MQATIQCGPSFSMLDVDLAEGEKIIAEGGSMTWMQNVKLTTNMTGGIMSGLKRAVTGESMFLNTIEGNSGANVLRGLGGSDSMRAGDGDDLLFGGAEVDRMRGESGADTILLQTGDIAFGVSSQDAFRFNGEELGLGGTGGPAIRDFDGVSANAANGEDKLVFATGLEVGTFAYIGTSAFSASGNSEARFALGPGQVQVDQDGDGSADINFLVDGVTAANLLTATDFVWL